MVKVIRNGEEVHVIQKPYKYIGDKELFRLAIIVMLICSFTVSIGIHWIAGVAIILLASAVIVPTERDYRWKSKAAELWISTDRIRVMIDNEVYREITFDEEVEVELFLSLDEDEYHLNDDDNWLDLDVEDASIMEYGPLSGYLFSKGKTKIYITDHYGWNIQDIRDLWDVVFGIIEAKGLSTGENLLSYIEMKEMVQASH